MAVYPRSNVLTSRKAKVSIFASGKWTYSYPQVAYMDWKFSDAATVRRIRPKKLSSALTPLTRMYVSQYSGSTSFTAYVYPHQSAIVESTNFRVRPPHGGNIWLQVPGMSVLGSGKPAITRNTDIDWLLDNKLLSKIKDVNANLPVALLEANKTASWMAQRVTSIAQAVKAVKRGKWERVRDAVNAKTPDTPKVVTVTLGRYGYKPVRTPKHRNPNRLPESPPEGWNSKNVSERWLEVQYAIKPLMGDVEGMAVAYAKYLYDNQLAEIKRTVKDLDYKTMTLPYEAYATSWIPTLGFTPFVSIFCESVIRYKKVCTYLLDKYLAAFTQQGLTNAPSAAYEVIPYSFVVDWFITTGDYLELMDATVACAFLSGTTSKQLHCSSQATVFDARKATEATFKPPAMFCTAYERVVNSGFPQPHVVVKSPLSGPHLLSALALLRGMRK